MGGVLAYDEVGSNPVAFQHIQHTYVCKATGSTAAQGKSYDRPVSPAQGRQWLGSGGIAYGHNGFGGAGSQGQRQQNDANST